MRILWITNIIMPAVCKYLNLKEPVVGGWMYSLLESISKISKIKFAVATVYNGKDLKKIQVDNVTYYLLPLKSSIFKYSKSLELYWNTINDDFKPDLVHLHGTEYPHGLAFLNSNPSIKSIVSIQGLVSVYSNYFYAGMSNSEILKNISFRDVIRRDSIYQAKIKMKKRGLFEKETIEKVNYVIGRTSWDKSHTYFFNKNAEYLFCNETLRDVFFQNNWSYEQCEKNTIFISQAGYPIKGLHKVLKAATLLKEKYKNIRIKVAGPNIIANKTLTDKIKINGYGKYIKAVLTD